jgi:hypothetical protein
LGRGPSAGGGFPGQGGGSGGTGPTGAAGPGGAGFGGFSPGGSGRTGFGGGGGGGLLSATAPSAALTRALQEGASGYTWVAAVVGANDASGYQLASRDPVMDIGGFNGTDPDPSLAQFEKYVAEKKVHYFIAGGSGGFGGFGGRGGGSGDDASQITSWVESNFTSTSIGGTTVYNLAGGQGHAT